MLLGRNLQLLPVSPIRGRQSLGRAKNPPRRKRSPVRLLLRRSNNWILSGQNAFLEAMLLARSFQPTGQPTFHNITMPVSPMKGGTLPSDRPFIQPGLVSQTSSELVASSGEVTSTTQAPASVQQEVRPVTSASVNDSVYRTVDPVHCQPGPCWYLPRGSTSHISFC